MLLKITQIPDKSGITLLKAEGCNPKAPAWDPNYICRALEICWCDISGYKHCCVSKLICTCSFGTCTSSGNADLSGCPESWVWLCYASATCPDYSWHNNIPIKGPFVFDGMETELDIISLMNKGRRAFSQIQLPASHAAKLALCIKSE